MRTVPPVMIYATCTNRGPLSHRYVFGDPKEKDETSRRISDDMGTYWTNVAKHLSPNAPAGTGGSQPTTWPRFNTTGDM